ncbi:MAG: polysaccharide deacetylase family protein [Solirubrobacterales bacterium]
MAGPLILAYHGIATHSTGGQGGLGLLVRPDELRRDVRLLQRWGYELVTVRHLAERLAAGSADGLAALTFDDGLADNLEVGAPVLAEFGVVGTTFCVSGWLGQPHPDVDGARIMTADEVRTLRDAGWEIGAHTRTHPDLPTLTRDQARGELQGSRKDLEELLGEPVRSAAYPYGTASAETIEACREAGFTAAVRNSARGDWADPLNLPRQDMEREQTGLSLRLKRRDLYEPLMERRAGRAARRLSRLVRSRVGG